MVLELMPCATHSRLWCGFDAVSSGLPPPFSSLLSFSARVPLLSLWLLAFLFVWISSFASATLSTLCFSMSSRQPSLFSGPSPRISTAGAYCWQSIITPLCLGGFQVRTPDGVLRKVRDSNPRIVSDCRVSSAVLSTWLSQPSNVPCASVARSLSNNRPTSQVLDLARCKQPLNLIPCI